jgi:hypothetical protein
MELIKMAEKETMMQSILCNGQMRTFLKFRLNEENKGRDPLKMKKLEGLKSKHKPMAKQNTPI